MYSITASRRMALQSAALECWPEGTVHTSDDVIINGTSLAYSAHAEQTPAVRIGAAGVPWPKYSRSLERFITVVLTRVEQMQYSTQTRKPEIWVDAELERCRPILSAARLIGRESTRTRKRMRLQPHSSVRPAWVWLPGDIVVSDLIVVPCDGTLPLSDVRRRDHHLERLSTTRTDTDHDDFPYLPSCLK